MTISVTDTSYTAIDLEEFEAYYIQVAAMTDVGLGPFSYFVKIQTFEDGKCCMVQWINRKINCYMLCMYDVIFIFIFTFYSSLFATSKCAS